MAAPYTSHKFIENQVWFVTEPSRVTAKYEGCQKSQGNSLLVNYAHDYLIT